MLIVFIKSITALFLLRPQDFKRLMHSSGNSSVSSMWPEGKISVTEVTKRPATAGTIFKNSMIALTQNLASKVSENKVVSILTNDL